MIRLTLSDGTSVAVNPLRIFYIRPLPSGCQVVASDSAALDIVETIEEVEAAMIEWERFKAAR